MSYYLVFKILYSFACVNTSTTQDYYLQTLFYEGLGVESNTLRFHIRVSKFVLLDSLKIYFDLSARDK